MGLNLEFIKKILIAIAILIFIIIVSFIYKTIKQHKQNNVAKQGVPHFKRKLPFMAVIVLGCIAIIPWPVVLFASSISAAGGARINWTNPLEMLTRLLYILTIFYPLYITAPFLYGRELILKRNKKIGYIFLILSGILSTGVIIFFISMFVKN